MLINLKTNAFLSKCKKITTVNLAAGLLIYGVPGHAQGVLDRKISLLSLIHI